MAQPKTGTLSGMTVEEFARRILKGLIKQSVAGPVEYGGVIYRNTSTNELGTTGPFKGDSPTHVDVRVWAPQGKTQKEWNAGCPQGTKPIAWYHTHPVKTVMTLDGPMHAEWDKFIDGDKLISDSFLLPGYVATMNGQFWRYDHPEPVMVGTELVPTEGKGRFVLLNDKI